jgi:hypothetical protein
MTDDPSFTSAVERAYLAELAKLEPGSLDAELTLHAEVLERAIYKADPTNGGLRFKKLHGADELEARLHRTLSRRLKRPPGTPGS